MQGSLYAAAAGLLSVLLLALTSWLQRQQAAGQGAALQAARDTAASDAVVIPAQAAGSWPVIAGWIPAPSGRRQFVRILRSPAPVLG